MKKRMTILAVLMAAVMLLSGTAAAAASNVLPSAEMQTEPAPSGEPSGEASGPSSEEPSEEPSAEPLPLIPGTYEGEDGSVLKVKEDGSATYETLVSGSVNGRPMSGRLTFHGELGEEGFSFDRVTYFMLDLTDTAKSLGYEDASLWEGEADALYAEAVAASDAA